MKLLKLEVEGYRSLKSVSWEPGDLNVLIGPNAGGKSSVLRVLELLSAGAQRELGRYIIQHEGGMESIVWDGQAERIRISATTTPLPPYSDPATDALTYKLDLARLGATSSYRIDNEVLGNFCQAEEGGTRKPVVMLERRPGHAVVYSMAVASLPPGSAAGFPTITTTTKTESGAPITAAKILPGYSPDSAAVSAAAESLRDDEALLSFCSGPFSVNSFAAGFQRELDSWKIHQQFETGPRAPIRESQVTRADTQLEADGQNLVAVLHTLYTGNREFEDEINNAMFAAFGDDFVKLTFPPAADQRVQLRIRWRSLKRERSAADLSDGTLRFLFLLAILANPSPPPLIAIDEPETGLHPKMLRIVAEYAREAARTSQVILSTHSAELLDAFGREPPTTTIVEREEGQTVLRTVAGGARLLAETILTWRALSLERTRGDEMKFILLVEGKSERQSAGDFLKRWLDPRLSQPVGISVSRFNGYADLVSKMVSRATMHLEGPRRTEIIAVIALLDLYIPDATFYPADKTSADDRYAWGRITLRR